MQHILYAFLIASANNVDNLGGRIAYSIQGTKISALINLWISLITFAISSVAAFSGASVTGALGAKVTSTISMALLVALGYSMILQSRDKNRHDENSPGKNSSVWTILLRPEDNSEHIDFMEGTVLGVGLSINNIGGGLSAGMIGLDPLLVGFLSAGFSFAALSGGNYLAEFFIRRHITHKTAVLGGILLIAIGINQVVG